MESILSTEQVQTGLEVVVRAQALATMTRPASALHMYIILAVFFDGSPAWAEAWLAGYGPSLPPTIGEGVEDFLNFFKEDFKPTDESPTLATYITNYLRGGYAARVEELSRLMDATLERRNRANSNWGITNPREHFLLTGKSPL